MNFAKLLAGLRHIEALLSQILARLLATLLRPTLPLPRSTPT